MIFTVGGGGYLSRQSGSFDPPGSDTPGNVIMAKRTAAKRMRASERAVFMAETNSKDARGTGQTIIARPGRFVLTKAANRRCGNVWLIGIIIAIGSFARVELSAISLQPIRPGWLNADR
jgi:hypothetical protein